MASFVASHSCTVYHCSSCGLSIPNSVPNLRFARLPLRCFASLAMTGEEAVLHYKSKHHNYHNLSRFFGIIFISLFNIFEAFYFTSLFEKRGLRLDGPDFTSGSDGPSHSTPINTFPSSTFTSYVLIEQSSPLRHSPVFNENVLL